MRMANGSSRKFSIFIHSFLSTALAVATASASAESARFHRGAEPAESASLFMRVAAAAHRGDGGWLTLGTHQDGQSRDRAHLILRDAAGAVRKAVALAPDDGLSWWPRSMLEVGTDGDVIVFALEYDDISAPFGMALARIDAQLGLVWSRHLRSDSLSFAEADMRAQPDGVPLLVGRVQRIVDGQADAGDILLAGIDVDSGELIAPRMIGATDWQERGADVVPLAGGRLALLAEVRRGGFEGDIDAGDGLIVLDASGAVSSPRLVGHEAQGLLVRPTRLLPAQSGWIIAGRISGIDVDTLYLHRLDADLVPAPTRSLIPAFHMADIAADEEGLWAYGGANAEILDSGSVLMRLGEDFSIELQRRYATDNASLPSGALAFGDGGLLLALEALRSSDAGLVGYESVSRMRRPDGEGLLCEEGAYSGFEVQAQTPIATDAWQPVSTPLVIATEPAAVVAQAWKLAATSLCTNVDDLLFRDGFDGD